MKIKDIIVESSNMASAEQIWDYVGGIHPKDQQGGGFLKRLIMRNPQYELKRVPLSSLHVPNDEDEGNDPYGRAMFVDVDHAREYSQHHVDKKPVVADAEGHILDGAHRAWAAAELLNRTDIMAWVPAKKLAEGKVKLHTDPGYFGAEVDDTGFDSLPVVNIPTNQLVGFEPDSKMNQPKSQANVEKIVAGLKKGDKLPPLLVRKYKNGYQVLDGHHRFWAYKLSDTKSIPVQIVADKDIEEISKQGMTEGVYRGDWVRHPDNPWQIGQIQSIDNGQAAVTWKKTDKRKKAMSSTHAVDALQHARREFSQLTQPTHSKPGVAEGFPQPGPSSGAPKQFGPDAKIQTRQMTVKDIISSVPGVPYYNNVVDDWDAKDYSWGVTKKVIEYATYLKDHPESLAKLPPAIVLNGKFEDGAHRVSAIWLLQQRMDPKNPLWANAKLNVQFVKQGVAEGESNDTAISLSKLGKFHPGADTLAQFVPERATAQYALHPDKWESTFYSLTNKDSDKLKYYGPKKISIPPGTLVGDMAIANKFYRAKTTEEKQQYAELYKQSLKPYPVDVGEYRMPELLIPKPGVAEGLLNEGLAHPVIVVDVQPEYNGGPWPPANPKFIQIMNFVQKQTGPVLFFVNAEDQGLSGDSIQQIQQFWDETLGTEGEEGEDENGDYYYNEPESPIDWRRFEIVDKGFGYLRSWMDHGIEPATIIATIRELYQQKKSDSRGLQFPAFNRRTPQQALIMGAMQEMEDDPISVNWTSVAQLKRFNGAYIVGGARDQCLREVELLMNAFNIKYKRIDSLIYEGQPGVAENFADGRNPGRKGLAKRSGVNTKASVSSLRNTAKHSTGEKQRMAHWLANMKAGRAKKK